MPLECSALSRETGCLKHESEKLPVFLARVYILPDDRQLPSLKQGEHREVIEQEGKRLSRFLKEGGFPPLAKWPLPTFHTVHLMSIIAWALSGAADLPAWIPLAKAQQNKASVQFSVPSGPGYQSSNLKASVLIHYFQETCDFWSNSAVFAFLGPLPLLVNGDIENL